MPLVAAKCTNCGASVNVDNAKDAAICEFCNTPFIVEKAINNYNISNNNTITNSVVNIYGGNSEDFVIRAGVLEKYTGASIEVVIPNSVTSIKCDAFSGCDGLKSITIPDSVTSIDAHTFNYCKNLVSVTIPNSVTRIGEGAFEYCSSLISIAIPNSVTEIAECAFLGCTSLASVTIPNGVTEIAERAFLGCTSLVSITIPNSVAKLNFHAFKNCTNLVYVTIPDSVTEIEGWAFEGCINLTSIVIPDSVRKIGCSAFSGCSSLTSITFPNSMNTVEETVFQDCTALTSLNIPNSVREIKNGAFSGCTNLTSVIIAIGVSEIGRTVEYVRTIGVFCNCTNLTSITIPDSVTKIGGCAFEGCTSLATINAAPKYIRTHIEDFRGSLFYERKKDGCYLTTACMEHQLASFDDNCHELTVLRSFRDSYLKSHHPEDIQTYYLTAPSIVDAINSKENATAIWAKVYDELIVPSVDSIQGHKLEQAYTHYKIYGLMLGEKYLKN
ncbi:leucine-rich repeat protein [Bengtsoniella intestinalis]|uniref:leucine-rich repeat domain-containing protein n=1 Tax=Bengtsoniella intestinalis TaxID=3073143 RepID=UPI00391F7742